MTFVILAVLCALILLVNSNDHMGVPLLTAPPINN